jgi:hypothetical protein
MDGHCGVLKEASMEKDERIGNGESRLRAIRRLAGVIALAALSLMIVVVVICWFAGWRTLSQVSSGLTRAGATAIAVGVLSTLGGWGLTRDSQYMYVQSVSHQDMSARTRQGLRDSLRGYNLAIVATAAGILCLVAGALI